MPRKRIVPDHGLCPRCYGEHDRLLDTGEHEHLVCDTCGTSWLSPAPRPWPSSPNQLQIAEAVLELALYEPVRPVFAPISVEA